ncbi:MAG TPA: putative lipid II flippase FtsW [Candidatus Pristimantibacillus sp.]|nr:putative lipid II flippase FtsW [Candidatus Pristimantibacillus sp.]
MGAVARRSFSSAEPLGARRHRPDYWLLVITALLLAIGLVVVYSISPGLAVEKSLPENYFINRQLVNVGLGLIVLIVTANMPLKIWERLQNPLLIAAGISAVAVRVFGQEVNGAYRWINIGGLSFQAVELIKLALLVWLAGFLAARIRQGTLGDVRQTFRPLLIALAILAVVVAGVQSDLGSTGVAVIMMVAMAFVAGLPMRNIILIGAGIVLMLFLAVSTTGYRQHRLMTFLNPTQDCLNTGYQACQALIAVGSGGMVGLGLGNSVQAFGYLPEAENDSIFAIYAEKFGFFGVSVLLALFLAFFARLKRIMERAPDDFSRLLVTGIFAWLVVQSMINIGAMIGLLPLKGITLPFISYGGTSVVFILALIGIAFQISRYTLYSVPRQTEVVNSRRTGYENTGDRRRVRGAYHPNPGSRA